MSQLRCTTTTAGIPAEHGLARVDWPRDVPEDASPEFVDIYQFWRANGSGHTPSWLTLAELVAFDWKGKTTVIYEGLILESRFQGGPVGPGFPNGGAGDRFIGTTVLTPEQYEAMQADGSRDPSERYAICRPRQVTYHECCKKFVDETLPELAKLGDPKDVRIVFFFDS